jgi:hypothetical protein
MLNASDKQKLDDLLGDDIPVYDARHSCAAAGFRREGPPAAHEIGFRQKRFGGIILLPRAGRRVPRMARSTPRWP